MRLEVSGLSPEVLIPDQNEVRGFWRIADRLLIGVFILAALFYLWTDASSGAYNFGSPQGDFYNQLADGILHGHLGLLTPAPPGLTHLTDPYSPQMNGSYQGSFHDLALYHGHFYLTWGPVAVFFLFLPWRLLHVGELPVSFAVFIMSTVGLGFVFAAFRQLVRQAFGTTSLVKVTFGAMALAFSSAVPYLLRRPSVYEVAISSGYMFVAISMYFIPRSLIAERHSGRNLVVGSVGLGLAFAGRSDLLVIGCMALPLLILAQRRRWKHDAAWRVRLLQTVLPYGAIILLVFAYNYARFGGILDNGEKYVLAGYDPTITPLYQIGYLSPSLYSYLIAPPQFSLSFPYFLLPPPNFYPGSVPQAYDAESIAGVLSTTPIVLWAGFSLVSVRLRLSTSLRWMLVLPCAIGLVIILLISFSIPGGTERYVADFSTWFIFSGVIGWMTFNRARVRRFHPTRCLGPIAVVLGTVIGIAISISGEYNPLPGTEPHVYSALERLTSPLPDLIDKILGHPVITGVSSPSPVYATPSYTDMSIGKMQYFYISLAPTVVDVLAPSTGTIDMWANVHIGSYGDVKALTVSGNGVKYRVPMVGANMDVLLPVRVHAGANEFTMSGLPVGHATPDEPFLVVGGLTFENVPKRVIH